MSQLAEPMAYLSGEFLPQSQLCIPYWDAGFVMGATVTEQLRTFQGQLFELEPHFDRLFASLELVGIHPTSTRSQLESAAQSLVDRNRNGATTELGLGIFVTPGAYAVYAAYRGAPPAVGMYTYPLQPSLWATSYESGVVLVTTSIRQVSAHCWPAHLKCRSRMHYYLAAREAQAKTDGAYGLLLHEDGTISETPTANVLVLARGTLWSPPIQRVLPGISLNYASRLANQLGINFAYRDLTREDLIEADEVMLSSTSTCLLPVTMFDGDPVGSGQVGATFRRLIAAWSDAVGVDITAAS